MLARDRFLGDRKNTTGAKNGNALGPGFHFMRRVTGNNLFLFIFAVMLNVIDRHNDLETVVRFLVQEALNDRDTPCSGVNVIQTGLAPTLVRVSPSV